MTFKLYLRPKNQTAKRTSAPRSIYVMSPFVCLQRRSLSEAFTAQFAHIRLLAGMRTNVLNELIFFGETFRTNMTSVRLVAGMRTQMKFQFFLAGQFLAANFAYDG